MAIRPRRSLPIPLVRLALVACVPLIALFAVSFARIAVADYQLHQKKLALERNVEDLKRENGRLKQQIDYLNTDAGLELLAREELGWVKPGDTAVVVVQDPAPGVSSSTSSSPTPTPLGRRVATPSP